MRDPVEALRDALAREVGGIAIVWSPLDFGIRDWLVSQVEALAPDRSPVVVRTAEEALALPHRMALVVPRDERETVLDLDASRDLIRSEEDARTQPIVLFLFREGDGHRALREAVSLNSLVRGNDPDPEAIAGAPVHVNQAQERAAFEAKTGQRPEAWLADWHSGVKVRNAENYALAVWADFLGVE